MQPVDPLNLWHRPPFEPVVTDHADGRKIIVARGAEDDKGQLMTFIEACRAWKKVTGSLPVDVTILIEGEEEVGSKNFVPFMEAIKDELKADFALVCDTGMWDPNTPAITTSLRGLMYDEVTIKAANRDLHSGVFGGGARNPIRVLTNILGGLFDDNGRITIPGFYDGVKDLPPDILAQWKNLNLTPELFLKPIGLSIPAGEKDRLLIEQVSSRPTCDINGIIGGYTGEGSKTVIPAEASAKVSFRLVEGQDPQKIKKAFRDYVTARLPGDCKAVLHRALQRGGDRARLEHEAAGGCQARADRGMGQGGAAGRLRRLDPDRRGFQAYARPRQPAGRLRSRRRQHPFAEREVRPEELPQGHPLLGADFGRARGGAALIAVCRSQAAGALPAARYARLCSYFRQMEMCWFWLNSAQGPGLSGLLHATLLRRSIPQMTVSSPGTDRFDLPLADETVGDMIRIPGGTHAEAIATSTSVSGLVASCAGGLAMEANSSR